MTDKSQLFSDPLLAGVPSYEGYKVLGPVVLYHKIGRGGMGAVYKGRHLRLNIDVAVKVMAPPAGMSPEALDNFSKRFLREAQTAAGIIHQNLVHVSDMDTSHGLQYLVMEYVEGESAAELLKRLGPLPEREALRIVLGAAEGLAKAHAKNIVHRDIKPDNILVTSDGEVKVADLGLAKALGNQPGQADSGLTISQAVMGTPYYMSPEQTRSARDVKPPTDVWSLGVTLYQLLTDSLPWRDDDLTDLINKIRKDPQPDFAANLPQCSEQTRHILEKSLQKDPGERYSNCGEMVVVLRKALEAAEEQPKQPKQPETDGYAKTIVMVSRTVTPPPRETLSKIAMTLQFSREGGEAPPVAFAPTLELPGRPRQETPAPVEQGQGTNAATAASPQVAAAETSSGTSPTIVLRQGAGMTIALVLAFLLVILLAGGGVAFYFLVVKPGRQVAVSGTPTTSQPLPRRTQATAPAAPLPEKPSGIRPKTAAPATGKNILQAPAADAEEEVHSPEKGSEPVAVSMTPHPGDKEFNELMRRAENYLEAGSPDGSHLYKALAEVTDALAINPDNTKAIALKYEIEQRISDMRRQRASENKFRLQLAFADSLAKKGEWSAAVKSYREAVEIAPDENSGSKARAGEVSAEYNLHYERGLALEKEKKLDAALDEYRLALAARPDDETCRRRVEVIENLKAERKRRADEESRRRAVALENFEKSWKKAGEAEAAGDLSAAREAMSAALDYLASSGLTAEETGGKNPESRLAELDKRIKAESEKQQRIQKEKESLEKLLEQARETAGGKDWEAAAEAIRKAEKISPDDASVRGVAQEIAGAALRDAFSRMRVVRSCTGHSDKITRAVFSPSGNSFATASWDRTVKVWDFDTGMLKKNLAGHTGFVWDVAYSPDGTRLVSASSDKTARGWNPSAGTTIRIYSGHTDKVNGARYSPDGSAVATWSDDGTARIWATRPGGPNHILLGHEKPVTLAVFSPDSRTLLTVSKDKTARLWEVVGGRCLQKYTGMGDDVSAAAFCPGNASLLIASEIFTAGRFQSSVTRFAIAGGRIEWKYSCSDTVMCLDVSAPAGLTAVGCADGKAALLETDSGVCRRMLPEHGDSVTAVRLVEGGKILLTASADGSIRAWDIESGKLIVEVPLGAAVTDLVLSPNGRRALAVCGDEKTRLLEIPPDPFPEK